MRPEKVKTFEELREDRAREWSVAQGKAAQALGELLAGIAKMPDVLAAPAQGVPWGHPGIACPHCGSEGFLCSRWVTCNGIRHRAELACLGCKVVRTWDWGTLRWL